MSENGQKPENEQQALPPYCMNFIFAARWDVLESIDIHKIKQHGYSIEMIDLKRRLQLSKIKKLMAKADLWNEYTPFTDIREKLEQDWQDNDGADFPYNKLNDKPMYGESLFFNRSVRKLIYQTESDSCETLALLYQLKNEFREQPMTWTIIDSEGTNLTGKIIDIELRFYTTGVMLLSFQVDRPKVGKSEADQPEADQSKTEGNAQSEEGETKTYCKFASLARRLFSPAIDDNGKDIPAAPKHSSIKIGDKNCTADQLKAEQSKTEGNAQSEEGETKTYCKFASLVRRLFSPAINNKGKETTAAPKEIMIWSPKSTQTDKKYPKEQVISSNYYHPEYFSFLSELIGPAFVSRKEFSRMIKKEEKSRSTYVVLDAFCDDRMFFHGYLIDTELISQLQASYPKRDLLLHRKWRYGWKNSLALRNWYALLVLDHDLSDPCCKSNERLKADLKRYTYDRWLGDGTLYGISESNFIMLLKNGSPAYLPETMLWSYYQLFLIALLQKCSITRFFEDAGAMCISKHHIAQNSNFLRGKYIQFINSIWGQDITMQQQGMELYRQLNNVMRIDKSAKALDTAMDELHAFESNAFTDRIGKILSVVTIIGALWALLEMGLKIVDRFSWAMFANWKKFLFLAGVIFAIVFLGGALYWLIEKCMNRRRKLNGRKVKRSVKHNASAQAGTGASNSNQSFSGQ